MRTNDLLASGEHLRSQTVTKVQDETRLTAIRSMYHKENSTGNNSMHDLSVLYTTDELKKSMRAKQNLEDKIKKR